MSTGMGPWAKHGYNAIGPFKPKPIRERLAELVRDYDAEARACALSRPDASEAYSDAAAMLRGVIREIAEAGQ